jgi:hypothetical protein
VQREHHALLVADDPERLIAAMQCWTPPASSVLADAAQRAAAIGEDVSRASDAAAS